VTDAHLILAGEACLEMPLTTGGAGLGMGIARALMASGCARGIGETVAFPVIHGPSVILSGSCSGATLAQVKAVAEKYPCLKLDPIALARNPEGLGTAVGWALKSLGDTPIVLYASAPPEEVAEVRRQLGQEQAAEIVENAFRVLARELAEAGVNRFVVAGGETAGAVIEALGVKALKIGPEITPGVPWTATVTEPVLLLALKSGNFGPPEFFMDAFEVLP